MRAKHQPATIGVYQQINGCTAVGAAALQAGPLHRTTSLAEGAAVERVGWGSYAGANLLL